MSESGYDDKPRTLKREDVREERRRLLHEVQRVAVLKKFVEEMRDETEYGNYIPHFDPLDGGVEAKCLFLFEAAGGKAISGGKTKGSGFVSRNNDDATAQKFFELNDKVLDRTLTASWNIVPWALRETGKNRKPTSEEIRKGLLRLDELLKLMRNLQVVVLCGASAQKATQHLYVNHQEFCVLHAPHPAPQSMLQEGKEAHLRAAIRKAAAKVSG